jgi:multiple sugar transport system substrate-binding protein
MGWKHRQTLLPVLVSSLGVVGFVSAGTPIAYASSGPVQITFATAFVTRYPIFVKIVKEFNASHPGIHVTIEHEPGNTSMLTKLLTELATGTAPNVVFQYGPWADQLASTKGIVALNSFIAKSHYNLNVFYKDNLETDDVNGKIIALPGDNDNEAVFYNKKLFEKYHVPFPKANWTWAQMIATAKKLNHPKQKYYGMLEFIGDTEGVSVRYEPFLLQAGGHIVNAKATKALFDSAAGIKALTFLKDLEPYSDVVPRSEYEDAFESGRVAMTFSGSWDVSTFAKDGVDYGVVQLPSPTPGGSHLTLAQPDLNLITQSTPAKEQASWTFLQYLDSEKSAEMLAAPGHLSFRKAVVNDPAYKPTLAKYPVLKQFAEFANDATIRPKFPQYSEVSQDMATAVEMVLLHKASPAAALKQEAQAADQQLQSSAP